MPEHTEENLPWDALWQAGGEIPWDALERIAKVLAEDFSKFERLKQIYEEAWNNAQDYKSYADLYSAGIMAMAAADVDKQQRRAISDFLLDKLQEAATAWDDVAMDTLTEACGAMGPVILPRVLDTLEEIETDDHRFFHLFDLVRVAAESQDEQMKQRVIRLSSDLLQKVDDGQIRPITATGAAWALASLRHQESLPLMRSVVDKTYTKQAGEGDIKEALQTLEGVDDALPEARPGERPVKEWLPERIKQAKIWYQGDRMASRNSDEPENRGEWGNAAPTASTAPSSGQRKDVGRNDPCPCGSGKKYKKCCFKRDLEIRRRRLKERRQWEAEWEKEKWELPEGEMADGTERGPETDEMQEVERYSAPEEPESPYPQIPESLPEITDEEEEIIETWCAEYRHAFKNRDADKIQELIEAFMEEHPDLLVHLGLHEEALFELGAELGRRGEHSRYAELLRRIRREHPEVYVRSYGYYDVDVIADLLVTGRREEVPDYFNYFKEYPDSFPGQLDEVLDLLASTNCQKELLELARVTAIPNARSPKVINAGFASQWLFFEKWISYLNSEEKAEKAAERLHEDLKGVDLPREVEFDHEWVSEALSSARKTFTARDLRRVMKESENLSDFYAVVCWNFTGFLHREKDMSWATARFFGDRIESYFRSDSDESSARQPFAFRPETLDEFIFTTCQQMWWVKGVLALSLLQSVYEIAGYLEALSLVSEQKRDAIREVCLDVHERCLKGIDDADAGLRVFYGFPKYPWT